MISTNQASTRVPQWNGAQIEWSQMTNITHEAMPTEEDMKEWILLDSQSICNLFRKTEFLEDIMKALNQLHLLTNEGEVTTHE